MSAAHAVVELAFVLVGAFAIFTVYYTLTERK